jgi:hypothetical protein
MQDVHTTNLNLARREMDAWCSQNRSISSQSALELTVAAGTNEVAMWALQLYIGFFAKLPPTIPGAHDVHSSNRLQPRDQHPATYSWLSLGHFLPGAPEVPFFHIMARYARTLSHLSNTSSYL